MRKLADINLFLLDMDGTFYLGNRLLPGAPDFLAACRAKNIPFTFLTNNSSQSAQACLQKLAGMGVMVTEREMFTSGDATLLYLQQHGFAKELLLIGTESLAAQFAEAGFVPNAARPKAVVLGFDTGITYEKLTALCNDVRAGLPYIATHPDFNCPVPGGMIPDVGAVIAFVKAATGREPDVVIGKPNAGIAEAVAARFSAPLESICMVGDRLYTDIALGECGVRTALVLSGETRREDLAASPFTPDYIFEDLAEMAAALSEEK